MSTVSVPRTTLALGVLMGGFHAIWAGLVAVGWAQPLLDFIFRLHFISPPYRVAPFDPVTAVTLVGVTAGIGAIAGLMVALVWNALAGKA